MSRKANIMAHWEITEWCEIMPLEAIIINCHYSGLGHYFATSSSLTVFSFSHSCAPLEPDFMLCQSIVCSSCCSQCFHLISVRVFILIFIKASSFCCAQLGMLKYSNYSFWGILMYFIAWVQQLTRLPLRIILKSGKWIQCITSTSCKLSSCLFILSLEILSIAKTGLFFSPLVIVLWCQSKTVWSNS